MEDTLLRELEEQVARLGQGSGGDSDTMMVAEVEAFIMENALDERASDALRTATPDVVKTVLSRGNLTDVRNPSSALLGRIRDTLTSAGRKGGKWSPSVGGGTSLIAQALSNRKPPSKIGISTNLARADPLVVQAFILENAIDDKAGEALMRASTAAQNAVLERGDFVDVRNASSALIGRLRDAAIAEAGARSVAATQQMAGRGVSDMEVTGLVEEFIEGYALDEKAAEALREADPGVQYSVLEKGSVSDCRNPSSAVLGRIREANANGLAAGRMQMQMGIKAGGGGGPRPAGLASSTGGQADYMSLVRQLCSNANAGGDEMGQLLALLGAAAMSKGGGCGGGAPGKGGAPSSATGWSQAEVAMMGLMAGAAGGQDGAPSTGSARQRRKRPVGSEPVDVEVWLLENKIDDKAADAVRACSPEAQQMVVDEGDVANCRNPSAVVMSRIKDSCGLGAQGHQQNFAQRGPPAATPEDVEMFILENALDDRSADAVRGCAPEIQRAVIDRGSTADTRNPSSAVQGRIRDALKSAGSGSSGGLGGLSMSNTELVNLFFGGQAPMSNSNATANLWGMGGAAPSLLGGSNRNNDVMDVQTFIVDNCVDDRAGQQLMEAPPHVQKAVLAAGHVSNCRNPSSVVLSRIASFGMNGGGAGGCGGGSRGAMGRPMGEGPPLHVTGRSCRNGQDCIRGGCHFDHPNGRTIDGNAGTPQGLQGLGLQGAQHQMLQGAQHQSGGGALSDFLMRNNLDEKAANDMMNESPEVQAAVMARGDLAGTRNPSSALCGRIRDAKKGTVQGHSSGPSLAGAHGRFLPY